MNIIKYRKGYKYQLAETYRVKTQIIPEEVIISQFLSLSLDGVLTIKSGYAWDGPSGPVPDTASNMRASLVHDAFYQLFRQEYLPPRLKEAVDRLFSDICMEDGVPEIFASAYYAGLAIGGTPAMSPENRKKTYTAPRLEEDALNPSLWGEVW